MSRASTRPNKVQASNLIRALNTKVHPENLDYIKRMNEKNIPLTVIGKYTDKNQYLEHICTCGYSRKIKPSFVLNGYVCKNCLYKDIEERDYPSELLSLQTGITAQEKYKGELYPIKHFCTCGNTWTGTPFIVKKNGCPVCNKEERNEIQGLDNQNTLNDILKQIRKKR